MTDPPKIHIDSDWKAEARAEKERLAAQTEKPGSARSRAGDLPEGDFRSLVGVLASQAIMGLGAIGDQKTGRVVVDLPGARFAIDLLATLEEKTRGNLNAEESAELSQVLVELRQRFVDITELVARQAAGKGPAAAGGGAGPAGPAGPYTAAP